MTIVIEAVYENGVLKPKGSVALSEGAEVRLVIDPIAVSSTNPGDDQSPPAKAHRPEPGESSRVWQTYGLIGWKGDPDVLERFALDPELDPLEGP